MTGCYGGINVFNSLLNTSTTWHRIKLLAAKPITNMFHCSYVDAHKANLKSSISSIPIQIVMHLGLDMLPKRLYHTITVCYSHD